MVDLATFDAEKQKTPRETVKNGSNETNSHSGEGEDRKSGVFGF
jgi:hypothetical protein